VAGIDLGIPQLSDVALLGSGGYSDVFVAHHQGLGRRVAVKVVPRMDDPERVATFERECAAMGRLSDHPNVVVPLSAGATAHGHRYILLELYPDGSCADLVRIAGPLGPADLREWVRQVGSALRTAHERGIVHNDVKPENVLVRRTDQGLQFGVTDFGLAHLIGDRTGGAVAAGSLFYVAPELLDGVVPTTESDVYGLAATACFMASGAPPIRRRGEEPWISVVRRIATEPVDPSVLDPIPAPFDEVVAAALDKQPRSRPTLHQLVAAAAQIDDRAPARVPSVPPPLRSAPVSAHPSPPADEGTTGVAIRGAATDPADPIDGSDDGTGFGGWWFAAALLVLFGVSVLVGMLFR
jgi:non-specific serine/threonine protein kinase